ncbi:hypothetical protein KRE40_07795 [Elizabethkingia meningoseptica]|uniref:hypothetical protein n=1 Tax=Elizabethkingia meningoseptica TaxID=238 RepID=UPI0009C968BC|nr:hypothetical protein [Elizabethkingia meningoseptica]MDE5438008.1 hypothetical protein [Elizabethkingia meningoseptica]MDE5508551.1 hypothetical protein [Elizabethkingia meningoseptica]MDE5516089.1 hypothetical protein [Elizabethkingia meningoseptica]MDE5526934.1 hypothetical protein [Elizabethkingia meningoseptica]MDE5531773.1 hypothetical protein [Elizabethkingia meningoseptica]
MDIKYMEQVKDNPALKGFRNEPMTITEISKLESKYNEGREFPKAFREFLFLAGNFNCYHFDDLGEGIDQLQQYAKEDLEMAGQKINRPFFAFDVLDSMYSVLLLDEKEEDPKVYLLMPFLAKGGSEPLIKPNGWDFTALVNKSIRRIKNNISA